MIIDATYFILKENLPQAGNTDGVALVNEFIDRYEKEYLMRIMGYSLWKAFTDGIEGSGVVDQRWTDLLEGKEFVYRGETMPWPGFENKPSPISQYVYYQFMDSEADSTTLVGVATADTDNATRANPVQKMVDAWNEMVKLNRTLADFLNVNKETYPEWTRVHCWDSPMYRVKNSMDI